MEVIHDFCCLKLGSTNVLVKSVDYSSEDSLIVEVFDVADYLKTKELYLKIMMKMRQINIGVLTENLVGLQQYLRKTIFSF
jgi:hypothetical protein